MNSIRWNQIKELFNHALTLGALEREQFLKETVNGDAELNNEVRSLLESAAQSDNEQDLTQDFFSSEDSNTTSLIGTSIGPFRVVREIARGGMGVVLEGFRQGEFTQRVAIKIIRTMAATDEIIRRFRAERAVLSSLNHPNIAKFIDGGNLSDGTPFLIMEFIEGVRIDEYCDRERYSIKQRLELFSAVCAAVHYAHQNLVVHRDLKPSNILVTSHGVKLLDFGIAKLLSAGQTEENLAATQAGTLFLTPEYASPEQLLGRNVTTASDTYSLGVLLYKLLTGKHPNRFKSPPRRDVEHAITEEQPTKPSSAILKADASDAVQRGASPAKLSKALSGDLDTIVLKALQKEPVRRYSSVEEFQHDIRRYLEGLPVSAQPDSPAYRFRKFIRRNTLSVTAAVLIFLSLAGGLVASLLLAQRAERERDRAQVETEKAKQVVSVLKEMFSSADRLRVAKKDITVADVLANASERIAKDFAQQPEIAADVLLTIGSTYEGLGYYEKAKSTMQEALRLQRLSHGNEGPDVAEALHELGIIYHMSDERAPAESLYTLSLAMFRNFNQPTAAYATTLSDYGVFMQDQEKYEMADSLIRMAIAMYHGLPSDNRKQLATSLHNLALNYDWLGRLAEADSLYRVSLALQREANSGETVQMAITIGNMGIIAEGRRDFREAEHLYRESLAIRSALLDADHYSVAANKIRLGVFLLDHSTRIEEAERLCSEGVASLLKSNAGLKRPIARGYLGIGRALEKQGRIRKAEGELRKAIDWFSQAQPHNVKNVAEAEVYLAYNLIHQQRLREAEALLVHTRKNLAAAAADSSDEMKKVAEALEQLYAARRK